MCAFSQCHLFLYESVRNGLVAVACSGQLGGAVDCHVAVPLLALCTDGAVALVYHLVTRANGPDPRIDPTLHTGSPRAPLVAHIFHVVYCTARHRAFHRSTCRSNSEKTRYGTPEPEPLHRSGYRGKSAAREIGRCIVCYF